MINKKYHPIYTKYLVGDDGSVVGPSGRTLKPQLSSKKSITPAIQINLNGTKIWVAHKKLVYDTFVELVNSPAAIENIDGDLNNNALSNLRILGEEYTWYAHPTYPQYSATKCGKILGKSGAFVNPVLCKETGYLRITLKDQDNRSVPKLAHRFIYEAVMGCSIPAGLTIDHLNGDKTDNKISNLEAVSQGENNARAREMGLNTNFGAGHYATNLTEQDVICIRRRILEGETVVSIHKDYTDKVKIDALYSIKQNRNWKVK